MPVRHTLVIVLAIVSLIVPGGLAMTIRVCETGAPSMAMSADCAMPCCAPSPYGGHGLDHPVARQKPCDGCYLIAVQTPERAKAATIHAARLLPPLMLWQHDTTAAPPVPHACDRLALRRDERAPPPRLPSLPLRI